MKALLFKNDKKNDLVSYSKIIEKLAKQDYEITEYYDYLQNIQNYIKCLTIHDVVIVFSGDINIIQYLFMLKNVPVILYDFKFWSSLISWYKFNNIPFIDNYTIINNISQFDKYFNPSHAISTTLNNKLIITIPTGNIKNIDSLIKNMFNEKKISYKLVKKEENKHVYEITFIDE